MRSLLIIIFSSLSFSSFAQDWVITTNQDTLKGEIYIEMTDNTHEEITIKNKAGKTQLKAYEFLSFYADQQLYETVKQGGIYRIMLLDKKGYLSLYYFRQDGAYDFGTKYLLKAGGDDLIIPNISYRKKMSNFLNDCSIVENGLQNNEYKKSEIHALIDDYNKCIEGNTLQAKQGLVETTVEMSPLLALINNIINDVNAPDSELHLLLNDIKNKLLQGKAIPGYLKSALKDQSEGVENIKSNVEELLKSI